jgi:hypothetical protein
MTENKIKISDIFGGIIIPIILVLLIFVFAVYLNVGGSYHVLGEGNIIAVILVSGFAQMIILGVPMVLGLLWNKWAGGAAGFIMGGLYYVANAGQYNGLYAKGGMVSASIPISPDILAGIGNGTITSLTASGYSSVPYNFFGDVSMLFYLVNAIIIGYMAGALCNGSTNFKRMLGAGLTAAVITAVIQAYMNYNVSLGDPNSPFTARGMAVAQWSDPLMAIVINFVPSIALGVIVPILAKVMTWYGLQPQKHAAGY